MFKLTTIIQKSIRFCKFSSSFPELQSNGRNSALKYSQKSIIKAAFASLKSNTENEGFSIKTPQIDEKISKASSIEELLSISDGGGGGGVSRKYALKVVSILAEWSSLGKVNISDFENDPRFIKLCRILTINQNSKNVNFRNLSRSEDLSTVLSVTADDEAAKMIDNITLSQMVKVMSTLSMKKRRSILLLRSLSYNITRSRNQLNLKECSDLLFSMATLNFPDENLLSRIAGDVTVEMEKNIRKSSIIGSILTSLGLLRYKNPALLDILSEWIIDNQLICRPQDIFSLLMTLAVVDYLPNNSDKLFQVILPQLTESEAGKPSIWLEIVWSLCLLNKANNNHINSIFDKQFINKLEAPLNISTKLKLLNIKGASEILMDNYNGEKLENFEKIENLPQSKNKQEMVLSILDTLKNLIKNDDFIKTKVNTNFGFIIDAVFLMDKKCNPVHFEKTQQTENLYKIAIITLDYHDICIGKMEPTGMSNFAIKLLKKQNYKILTVPFTEFNPREKLINRVHYLENKIKQIVN